MANLLARLNPFCEVTTIDIRIDPNTRESTELGSRTYRLPVAHLVVLWSRLQLVWRRRAVRRRPNDMGARLLRAYSLSHNDQSAAAETEFRRVAASSDADAATAARRMLDEWFGEPE